MAIHFDTSTVTSDRLIIWLYRCLALAWIAKGYLGWFYLITASNNGFNLLSGAGWIDFFALVVIPVLDIIAGVSLWISWRWGGGVWASVAVGYVCLALNKETYMQSILPISAVFLLLILHVVRVFLIRGKFEKQMKIL
jgi:hypothetical protein